MSLTSTIRFILDHPLNRKGRGAALGRFARWQIASRLMNRPIALPFAEDTMLLTEPGMTGATGNWYAGLHEHDDMGFVLHVLQEDWLFADIGANIGSYTVLAAGAVGAKVICFEPHPRTFRKLEANIAINHLGDRVEAHCCGLSDRLGELAFTADQDTVNHIMGPGETGPSITVPVNTLDAVLEGRIPAVIKIDVEGHERAVLDGASKTLAHPEVRAVLMETNGSGEKFGVSDDDLLAAMERYGFVPCSYDALKRKLAAVRGRSHNTIFVRDPDYVQDLASKARSYRLINATI